MLGRHHELLSTLIFLLDGLVIAAAWMAAYWIRFYALGLPAPLGVPPATLYAWMGAVLSLGGLLVLRSLEVYRSGRTARLATEWFAIARGVAVMTALAGLVSFFARAELSRATLVLFALLSATGLGTSRVVIRLVLRELRRRGRNLRRVLIVGTGAPAERLLDKIASHPHFGFEVLGLVAAGAGAQARMAAPPAAAAATAPDAPLDRGERNPPRGSADVPAGGGAPAQQTAIETPTALAASGLERSPEAPSVSRSDRRPFAELLSAKVPRTTAAVLGTVPDLARLVEETRCDIVYLALSRSEHQAEQEALAQLSDSTAAVRLVPDLARAFTLNASVEDFDGMPVVLVTQSPDQGWAGVLKRAFDLLVSFVALVVLSPVMLAIALWIRLDSRGPLLYVQERVGLNGRRFKMIKFRTMRPDAESGDVPGWTRPGDPRRTRLGATLRRFSLDELPQLWNVLKGEMSLVGPRPERPVYVDRFRASIPRYMLRHHVKAGITGWAQVHGLRGDTPLDERIRYDLDYIRNWSLALDVRILWMTVLHVLRDASAH